MLNWVAISARCDGNLSGRHGVAYFRFSSEVIEPIELPRSRSGSVFYLQKKAVATA